MLFTGDRKFLLALLIIVTLSMAFWLTPSQETDSGVFRISYFDKASDIDILFRVADQNGYFEGVEIKKVLVDKNPLATVLSGEADAVIQPVDQASLAYLKGDSLTAVAAIYDYTPSMLYISKFKTIEGASRVAVTRVGGAEQISLSMALPENKKITYIPFEAEPSKLAALESGEVDTAFIKWASLPSEDLQRLKKSGLYPFYSNELSKDAIPTALITKVDTLNNKHAQLKKIIYALEKSKKYIEQNPETTKEMLSKKYRINESELDNYYDNMKRSFNQEVGLSVDGDKLLVLFEYLKTINGGSGNVSGFITNLY